MKDQQKQKIKELQILFLWRRQDYSMHPQELWEEKAFFLPKVASTLQNLEINDDDVYSPSEALALIIDFFSQKIATSIKVMVLGNMEWICI